jgi:hypothetical protein
MWNDPNQYNFFVKDKLNSKQFANKVYGFYLELGRYMNEKNITIFDDISVQKAINELGFHAHYEKYGGYETISEIVQETKEKVENVESYISDVKKYNLLRELRDLYGEKVIKSEGKYDYHRMTGQQILNYWQDKIHRLSLNIDSEIKEHDLLDGMDILINELDENPDAGMPYYHSKLLNDTTLGWARGTVSVLSAFSGNGKTSFFAEKILMSCIKENEKLAIIANEMSCRDYQKILLITILGTELYGKIGEKGFNRKNINKGNFTPEEKEKLNAAVEWINETVNNKQLIKFIPMDDYRYENCEKVMRYYANRGYFRWAIDTAKPSVGGNDQRWVRFVEDSERLYQLGKKDGNGLNLAQHWNVQSADEAKKFRFLDELCLADGRKIKNVVDVCEHMRPLWADEYEGEKHALDIYKWAPDGFNGGYCKQIISQPKKGKIYYAMFFSKNRRGMSNVTGLDVLIYSVDFNSNRWHEVGWAEIKKDNVY